MSDDIVHYKTTTTKGMYMYVCMYVCKDGWMDVCVCMQMYCEQTLQVFLFLYLLFSELDHVLGDTQCDINGKEKLTVLCPA